jgi:hypothetical protein
MHSYIGILGKEKVSMIVWLMFEYDILFLLGNFQPIYCHGMPLFVIHLSNP